MIGKSDIEKRFPSGRHLLGALLFAALVGPSAACHRNAVELADGIPAVPLPDFAGSVEQHSANSRHLQRFFIPTGQHTLEDVRVFYDAWANRAKWRKLGPSEEQWSVGAWQDFEIGGRHVRQYLVHWTDPSGRWSLRLAMRRFPETGERDVWVIVEPFFNLNDLPLPDG